MGEYFRGQNGLCFRLIWQERCVNSAAAMVGMSLSSEAYMALCTSELYKGLALRRM